MLCTLALPLTLTLSHNLMLTWNQNLTLSLTLNQTVDAWNQKDVRFYHLQESHLQGEQSQFGQGISLAEERRYRHGYRAVSGHQTLSYVNSLGSKRYSLIPTVTQ